MTKLNIVPKHGERGFIVGQTGSGKTAFARWLLKRMPGTIVYDTKTEPKFLALSKSILTTVADAVKHLKTNDNDYAIVRPPMSQVVEPSIMDGMLAEHYDIARNTTAYLDEAYQFHNGGKAGPGLLGILTRGRSKGITTIMSTQRPAWIARAALTEAQHFYIFNLTDRRDHKTLQEIIPGMEGIKKLPRYHFYYYNFDLDGPVAFQPIPFEGDADYTDEPSGVRWF